ncbi:MAG: hypothetical protein SH847_13230 [Roseiflexaceae bacterium]|nr:hypothetical protein [Roseiflexaceae bacterium]
MTTTLDTLEMTRRIRDALYEQIKDMSPAERLAFYHTQAQKAHRQLGLPIPTIVEDVVHTSEESLQHRESHRP